MVLGAIVSNNDNNADNAPVGADDTVNNKGLSLTAETQIATGLKRLYGQMLAEPMPDKFAGLLDQLAKSEQKP
jgi:hypothetical protein